MTVFSPSEYTFLRFEKSTNSTKKYDAILSNKKTGKEKRLSFGSRGMAQYKDKVLGLYSSADNKDVKRRNLYRIRHKGEGDASRKWSPGWLSWHLMW